ncbi:MFS transporter [Actinorhabdospora filicis]|uniref:MFS transporter n=1 Tax=Actinorhabdospora filicis TaxID=1785913 RepID=A0A9W6W932_9ACTN|nr:MFS transporter [Actinorhabdospora filicis]GLZ76265.1 MFS transporter [Actinorhabdospora filicis]
MAVESVRSTVPTRLDRLPWSKFHWLVIIALGTAWILDGLEIQMAASIAKVLTNAETLALTSAEVGASASVYLFGQVVGALLFGRLADRHGRRKMFILTLTLYLVFNGLAGLSLNFWMFAIFRFVAGMGIGGEYAAIHSAIDELMPARYRGRVSLAISGTYWAGAALGAVLSAFLLNPNIFGENVGWRLCMFIGPLIGASVWQLRKHIPESPRWLMTHGRAEEAEKTISGIEDYVRSKGGTIETIPDSAAVEVRHYPPVTYREIAAVMLRKYLKRSTLGFVLMVTQSFLYNAIFFTYGLVLADFYGIPDSSVPWFFIPFALGNLCGPLVLGRFFDTIGRKAMIGSTYLVSAVILAFSGYLFWIDALTAVTQTILWCVVFFIASAAASSGYLTVSEIFPLELRSQAIAFFFAIAQFFGGVVAPWLFGVLIGEGTDRTPLFIGYLLGAGLMSLGGITALTIGVSAEGKSLEDVATPLSMVTGGER